MEPLRFIFVLTAIVAAVGCLQEVPKRIKEHQPIITLLYLALYLGAFAVSTVLALS